MRTPRAVRRIAVATTAATLLGTGAAAFGTPLTTGAALPTGAALQTGGTRAAAPAPPASPLGSARTSGDGAYTDPSVTYDARVGNAAQQRAHAARSAAALATPGVRALSARLGDQAVVDVDGFTGTPRQVAVLDGFLTGPSRTSAAEVALGYVRARPAVFGLSGRDLAGLRLTRDYVDVAGLHHLSWTQTAGGLPLYGNGLRANVTADGRLISVLGSPVRGLAVPAAPFRLTGPAAITAAKKDLSAPHPAPARGDAATKVLFATPGGVRPAWRTVLMSLDRPALQVVDAATGRVLLRKALTSDLAAPAAAATPEPTASVWTSYPGAPLGGTARTVDLAARGWLRPGALTLFGNNAHTYTDVNDDDAAGLTEEVTPNRAGTFAYPVTAFRPAGRSCAPFVCTWDPTVAGSWRTNRSQTAVQNFFFVNTWHDHLLAAPIGFTEAAGNFQLRNTTGAGLGGDPVQNEPLDGADTGVDDDGNPTGLPDGGHIDNANMATPPDGTAPRMQMYLFHEPGYDYGTGPDEEPFIPSSGADEADVVYHEYTHGLSNRLVVDATGVSTLDTQQSGSMGEAWSDWYAFDYLVGAGLERDTAAPGEVRVGDYVGAGRDLIRTQPLDCPVGTTSPRCPGTRGAGRGGYTYGDFGHVIGFPEVHADGEIWGETLWDLRSALGSTLAESLVTRAMELSPDSPSYLDMRNSIVQADVATAGGRHTGAIWTVFAARGMGFFAATLGGGDVTPVEDFSLPPAAGSPTGTVQGRVVDSASGAPVAGVTVALGGHDSGFPGSYATTTGSDGRFRVTGIPVGTYPDAYARGAGYDARTTTLRVRPGVQSLDVALRRDWAASSGGAAVTASNGAEFTDYGCGPDALIDQQLGVGWGSVTSSSGKYATVALPRAVDITSLVVDPGATCGDDATAGTRGYRVETSTDGVRFRTAATGSFALADGGRLTPVALAAGTGTAVRAVRFTMLSNHTPDGACSPQPTVSGCLYQDSSELEVFGTAH